MMEEPKEGADKIDEEYCKVKRDGVGRDRLGVVVRNKVVYKLLHNARQASCSIRSYTCFETMDMAAALTGKGS